MYSFSALEGVIVLGVGPRTALDIAYHVAILGVLVVGLATALRGPVT